MLQNGNPAQDDVRKRRPIMLESCLFESRPDRDRIGSRKKPATVAMATLFHVLIAAALILIPLLQTQAVPPVALPPPVVSLGAPVRIIKLAATPSSGRATTHPVSPAVSDAVFAPTAVPDKIAYVNDAIDVASLESLNLGTSSGPGGPLGTGIPGVSFSVAPPTIAAPPQPPPTPPTPPAAPKLQRVEPIRVSSTLQASRLLWKVDPVYPQLAKLAHVEGTVIAEARITQGGTVDSLRIISGNPLFFQSVLEAVKQWRYDPTILNKEPIDVITTITVNFRLN
jgi:protein TonB